MLCPGRQEPHRPLSLTTRLFGLLSTSWEARRPHRRNVTMLRAPRPLPQYCGVLLSFIFKQTFICPTTC